MRSATGASHDGRQPKLYRHVASVWPSPWSENRHPPTLRDQDGVLATCAAGWATRSAVGYADFTTQLADFTAALSSRLDHLESTTRAAAARYENADNDSARRIATAIEGTLNL